MVYTYDPIFAQDPSNPNVVASNASITLYDPADTSKTPITITDTTGSPLPNPIKVDGRGMGPAFQHPTLDRIAWTGGGLSNFFTAYEGMKNEAVAAKEAAQDAANSAASAAGNTVTTATVDGSGNLVLTKASGGTVNAGSVKGPKGDKGDKGADGANVLPTDDAIEAQIKTKGSKTEAALSATYEPKGAAASAAGPKLDKSEAAITYVALENVKKYGAKGDGVTDDSAAINAAIAALKQKLDLGTNGITKFVPPALYFPAGTYKCNSALTTIDFKYLSLVGDGVEASVLQWDGTGPLISLGTYTAAGGYGGTGANFTMRQMQVVSPANIFLNLEGARPGTAIQDNGSGGVVLEEVKLRGFKYGFNGAYGSDFDKLVSVHFANCDVGAYFGPGSQQVKIDNPNAEYCREPIVIEGAPQGSLRDGWFVLNSFSDITFEGNVTARSGVPGNATGGQYDMAWTIEDCWHETNAGGLGRIAPRMIMIQGAPPAAMKNVKIIRPYMVAGGAASSTDTFLEVATTGANAVAKILVESLSINGGHLGSLVKPTSGLTSIRVRNASITDGYTMPPIFATKAAGYVYVDEANKYIQGSNSSAFTEIRDNTGALDVRTRLLQNADTSLAVQFWTGSAYTERLRFDTQNSRIYLGNALDSYVQRMAAKVVGVGTDQGLRSGVFTTATRPSASAMGAGTQIYDSTLSKPLWSDGTTWRDAAGAAA